MELAQNIEQKPKRRRGGQPEAAAPIETNLPLAAVESSEVDSAEDSLEIGPATNTDDEDYSRQFVTFKVGDELFGLPIVEVQEIVRLPDVTRIPLASESLLGLSNLRGKALPIISLRRIFGFPDIEPDDATRILVIQHESLLGFVVDQVSSVMRVETDQIEGTESIKTAVNTDYLTGIIKNDSGKMIMILNFDQLVEAQFHLQHAGGRPEIRGNGQSSALSADDGQDADTLHFVSFAVESQEYAIPIEYVQEIVQVPENVLQVPNSATHVLGVINLRNRLLPLVSLRQMFTLSAQPLSEQNRIVVVHLPNDTGHNGRSEVGIVVDTVNEVLRVDRKLVDAVPKVLGQNESLVEITEIGRLDGGKRLVSFISAEHLFQHQSVRGAIEMNVENENAANDVADRGEVSEDAEDERHVVIFRLGDEEYGVPIEAINEIVRVPELLTRIPTAPSFVEGIMNLRGAVLPVIDQRRRFGMPEVERSDRQRIVVFNALGIPTGFIVDSVSEVYKISNASIEVTPSVSGGGSSLIKEVANLEKDKRMVLLLDVDRLLETHESAQLANLAS